MEAQEIRQKGQKIKSWETPDGAWYLDEYEIYEVEGKYYQIQNHVGVSFTCVGTFYDKVTEIEEPKNKPTHIGVVLGTSNGKVWIEKQMQGTLDEIDELYSAYVSGKKGCLAKRGCLATYSFRTFELHF